MRSPTLMTQPNGRCNRRRSGNERVLDNLDSSGTIHKRHVEACIHHRIAKGRHILARRVVKPGDLARGEAFGGAGVVAAFLDLDENQPRAVTGHDVNLAALPAPAPRRDIHALAGVKGGDLLFGRYARQIRYQTTHSASPRSSSSAS